MKMVITKLFKLSIIQTFKPVPYPNSPVNVSKLNNNLAASGFIRKWENRIPRLFQYYSRTFFHFSRTQFLPNFVYNNVKKCTFFSQKGRKEKVHSFSFYSDSGDKTRTTAQIESESHLAFRCVSRDFHSVFAICTKFFLRIS